MTNLNNIKCIRVGLNPNLPQKEQTAQVQEEAVKEMPQAKPQLNLMSGDEVLNVMAQQAAINKSAINTQKTYDVNKYVTPEQAQRIAGFVASFEGIVAKNLQSMDAEFGESVSSGAKMDLALSSADKMA